MLYVIRGIRKRIALYFQPLKDKTILSLLVLLVETRLCRPCQLPEAELMYLFGLLYICIAVIFSTAVGSKLIRK